MDAEAVKYILNNPLVGIGVIIIGIGCIEIGRMFSKWVEGIIKDNFLRKALILLGFFLIMILFIALCYKLAE